ncbi:hypothetical protein HA402_009444 [Bradysia odoriphaga]|nr:hypothetical protein HA402_009444 [Bradysia odoriphaga]
MSMLLYLSILTFAATVKAQCPDNICEGRPDGFFVNDPTGCRSYFVCINETPSSRQQCGVGYNFNEALQICDRYLPCKDYHFECPIRGISNWVYPGNCTRYNFCFGGSHEVRECAPGLHFDTSISECNLKEVVRCPRELCPDNNDIDNIVTVPSETDCEEYFMCYEGKFESRTCAPGVHWNQERQRCERPEEAECTVSSHEAYIKPMTLDFLQV